MKQKKVSISEWTQKSEIILQKVKDVLKQVDYNESALPTSIFDAEKPISIVFVGQFSAGKSTLIKALTGIKDIETGEGIKTTETHSYNWNGIEVVDTPGIQTTIHPDHDEISYEAISRADMLVYVVTEELFDDLVGQNFRKLLIETDKAAEMILVVNKMADIGNTEENRFVKLKDLEKVTTPYSPSDLRTVFVDAESYIDSLSEEDPDIATELKERSNYNQLVNTLNEFVADKGISSRLTTVLYNMFDILQRAISSFQSSTGDDEVDAIEEHLLRNRYIIVQTSGRIQSDVRAIYENAACEIRDKGRSIANIIFDCNDESEAEAMLEDAYNYVNEVSSRCEKDVISKIVELDTDYNKKLDDFYNSDFSQALQFNLNKKKDSSNAIVSKFLKSDFIARGSRKIIASSTRANAATSGLKAFSGSNAHEWVLNVGHYFGHSFKPWEAVKWVKRINTAGKFLGIFGVVLSWGMQIKDDYDEERYNREVRENREKLRGSFNEAANKLMEHYRIKLNNMLNDYYHCQIDEIDKKLNDISALRKNKSEACKLLENMQDECKQLISEIHNSSILQTE